MIGPAEPRTGEPIKDPTVPLWRSAVLLRGLTLLFAAGVVGVHHDEYARPTLAAVVVGVMTGWTVLTSWYYLRDGDPRLWFIGLDLAVCCLVMASSRLVLTYQQLTVELVPLVPTVWVTGAVAVGAVHGGRTGGAVCGLVVALCNYAVRGYVDTDLTRDLVLLVGIGFLLGFAASTSRKAARRLVLALRAEAATAERERLARSIHDGVLQVLARVRTRSAELDGEAAELARLAGEQEVALRALMSTAPRESTEDGLVDVGPGLQLLATGRVQVSIPATPVRLPAALTAELTALAREALVNVDKHAGARARAWVLLEDLGDQVVLSVRDDGTGIAPGRLEQAREQGRMGVARSIRGRAAALGGAISLHTAPGAGTEWEVRVPRERRPRTSEGAR